MIRRREFITGLGGAAFGAPRVALAQTERVRRIAVLIPLAESDAEAQTGVTALREGLQKLGWAEGRNARLDIRWATGDVGRIQSYAKELVALQPDIIVARATPVAAAVQRETSTIPIVFVGVSDPVGSGFAASLARPGGNATGFTNVEASVGGKWVEVLKEINPHIARIAVIFDPQTSVGGGSFYFRLVQDAARSIGVETIATPVSDAAEIEHAIEAFSRGSDGGLLVQPDVTIHNNRALIIRLAARYRLPAVYTFQFYVTEGGLASYGVDVVDLHRRAASYVDRILRGEKPGQLAVQAPVKFELTINHKTAKALGLVLPPMLLGRADRVIE
jgi:putative ABC transport system substrate-binding protein